MKAGRDEAGQLGGIEGVVFGVLLFVFGTLVVANAWGVVDAKLATTSAAREAARTYVEAPAGADPDAAARDAALEAIEAHGRRTARTTVERVEGGFARCQRVTVRVRYVVPLVAVPLLGQAGRGITVTSLHSEVVDPYRSRLAGSAACGP